MADPVTSTSETPNQPEAAAAASVAAPSTASAQPATSSTSSTPSSTTTPSAQAQTETPASNEPQGPTEAQVQALADAAASKTAEEAAATEAAKAAEAAARAPENYDVQLPEAIQKDWEAKGIKIDENLIPAMTPALKAAGVTQGQFNAIVGSFLEFQQGQPTRMLERDMAAIQADPKIGGTRYAQTLKEVDQVLTVFGDVEFKKEMTELGIANKPGLVRVFQRIGAALLKAGDTAVRGNPDAAPELTRAERMYGRSRKT